MIQEAFEWLCSCWRAVMTLPGRADLALDQAQESHADAAIPQGLPGSVLRAALASLSEEAGGRRDLEEMLFKMFTDLEIWRLPQTQLLTPWVPGQVLVAHVSAQYKELEERQLGLVDETRENLEEIARLNMVVAQLTSKLEATDIRSNQCMQKQADLKNTIRQLR
ncbi:unnamed protein product [Polarella glacialis]|uniref:Uncharacterized protein n=1 Tax=Polarella glacialis TaxID=89957 RepID=A0A813KYA3_POLGL|nr:unnamed protein product [Polarella glacialis]